VRQLQENLLGLGFEGDGLTPSGTFDDATLAAGKAWQASLGVPDTGVIDLGEAVFLPGAIRVAGHSVAIGDTVTAGLQVLSATSTDRVVVGTWPPTTRRSVDWRLGRSTSGRHRASGLSRTHGRPPPRARAPRPSRSPSPSTIRRRRVPTIKRRSTS
jgi:peptidoglycan hydrolase-like protein with peptidoglycan-binding domain